MAGEPTAEPQGQFPALLRRYAVLLISLIVICGALGAAAGLFLPQPFKATATVLVSPLDGNPYSPEGRGDDLINLETEAQLVSTDTVAKIARARLRRDIGGSVSVAVPANTQVLNLTYTANSAADAGAGAQAFADAYLEYRRQRAQAVVDGRLGKLKAQSARVERALREANRELTIARGSQRAYLRQRITAYTNQLGVIDEQSNDIASTPVDPGQVITPAGAGDDPGKTRALMYGVGGIIGGLLLGLVIMLLRERFNQRLRDAEGLEGLGVRALSTVPAGADGDSLVLVDAPRSPAGEGYRRLRAAVVATAPQTPVALLVTNATPGGSARLASANLAVALAYAGAKTIMIDATTEDADITTLFGVRPGKGLSDTLIGGADPATLLIHTDSQLRLLPRGARAREAAHRFSGPRMRETVKTLRRRSEYLVVNAPSLHDADAQAICTFVDAVVLVVDQDVTTREELRQAYVEAERAGATVLGALLQPPDQGRPAKRSGKKEPAAQTPLPGPADDRDAWADEEPVVHGVPVDEREHWRDRAEAGAPVDDAADGTDVTQTLRAIPDPEPPVVADRPPRRSRARSATPPPGPTLSAAAATPEGDLPLVSDRSRTHGLKPRDVPASEVAGWSDREKQRAEPPDQPVEPAATRTQEDLTPYLADEPDVPDDAAPAEDAGPVKPRYGKPARKAGRHAGS
ncbi:hypothetical protein [Actinomadura rayongensis]|uniref:Lipopolysaccharide biosynthesis protein n=1 Tax=Actinomadura rayongensis TaxID=1429076 RepID=A0A6I4WBR6_9ACTN|nr:hypothetical protein [Actinomadura rayongensis]MXQ64484.1 hypothetical protein [Actinomadura rayongensis]